jgi:hypothetical protein
MLSQRRNRALRWMRLLLGALGVCLIASSAHAYDLSRSYESTADDLERGFVVGSFGLWLPDLGGWSDAHQVSFDYSGELGIRFASIKGAHNLYVVGGFNVSPQLLDPEFVRGDRSSTVMWGYGGIRYMNGFLCFGNGTGCPFIELRFGLMFESAEAEPGHDPPKAAFVVSPGIGYRFSFGRVFQLGGRMDVSYTEENGVSDLGWLTLSGFIGVGW